MIPGYGEYADYSGIDVAGKIAVVQRGGLTADGSNITFADKMMYASWNNAIGVIVYNNDADHPDTYNVVMSTGYYQIPACFVSYNVGRKLAELEGTGVGISLKTDYLVEENATAGQISSFTSIGVTPDLRLKPEISAAGGSVYSSVPMLTQQGWLCCYERYVHGLPLCGWRQRSGEAVDCGDLDGSSAQSACADDGESPYVHRRNCI